MTPEEKRKKANEILDDTMTVSQAKKRKLDLRAKDLQIRAGSLKRKKDNDAAAKARRAKTAADKEQSAKEKRSAAKVSDVVAGIRKRKEKKAAAEKGKADKLKGIAAKRKAGVDKSLSRAKDVAKKGRVKPTIQKDEGELSAELKVAKGAAKGVIAGARAGVNVAKAAAKGIGAGIAGAKSKRAQGKVDAKERKIEKRNDKLEKAQDKKVKDRLNRRRMSKLKKMNPFQKKNEMKEELILLEIEKMEKKTDKIIDIMRGKNKIEISPKISEEVTGGVSIQDATDYTPLEIETVDIVTPKKLNHSDWRNDLVENPLTDLGFRAGRALKNMGGDLVKGTATSVKNLATGTPNTALTNPASARQKLRMSRIGNFAKGGGLPMPSSKTTTTIKAPTSSSSSAAATQTASNQADRTRLSQRPDKFFGTQTPPKNTPTTSLASRTPGPTQAQMRQKAAEQQAKTKQQMKGDPRMSGSSSSSTPPARTTSSSTLASKPAPKSKPTGPITSRQAIAQGSKEGQGPKSARSTYTGANDKTKVGRYKTLAQHRAEVAKEKAARGASAVGSAATKNEEVELTAEAYSALVRQGIKVGGKKGGRAVQAGEKAAAAKGREVASKAKEGNKKKMVGDGKYEKMGAIGGGVAGGIAGGILDGPLPVGDIVGGIGGSKVGGKIGRQIDKFRAKRDAKKSVKEEASDAMKDRQLERGGMGARRAPKKPISNTPNTFGKKKPKYDGMSAVEKVKASIRAQYGDKAIMDTKKTTKEETELAEAPAAAPPKKPPKDTGNPLQNAWNKFVPPPESSNSPGVRAGKLKPGSLEKPALDAMNKTAETINKPIKATSKAVKTVQKGADSVGNVVKSTGDFIKNNPGKAAAIGAGVVGAGLLAKKALGGGKKKEKNEHYDWRSEMGIVEEEGKKDACYKKVKASAKVWPSAYASGRLVQCRKKGAANYGNSKSK